MRPQCCPVRPLRVLGEQRGVRRTAPLGTDTALCVPPRAADSAAVHTSHLPEIAEPEAGRGSSHGASPSAVNQQQQGIPYTWTFLRTTWKADLNSSSMLLSGLRHPSMGRTAQASAGKAASTTPC